MADSTEQSGSRTRWKSQLGALPRALALTTVLLAVSVGSAYLLSPGLSNQQIPALSNDDLGKPFRVSSLGGFKASRDFEVLDENRTLQRREEARTRVRPVFDFDRATESKIKRDIRESFSDMRAIANAAIAQQPKPAAEVVTGTATAKKPKETKEDTELTRMLTDARSAFSTLTVMPEEEDFLELARDRFSPTTEQAIVSLIEYAYRAKIVVSRDELSRIDGQRISVRVLGEGHEDEAIAVAPQVLDLREAGTELERFASGASTFLPDASAALRRAAWRTARRQLRPNLSINIAETQARRKSAYEAVKPVIVSIKKGQRLIGDGELVNETHVLIVRSLKAQMSDLDTAQTQLGGAGLVALLLTGVWLFFQTALRRFDPSKRDAFFIGILGLLLLGMLHVWLLVADAVHDRYGWSSIDALHHAFPVAAGAMLVRFVLAEEIALFFAVIFSVLAGIMVGNSLAFAAFSLVTSLIAAQRVAHVKDRAGIFRAGFMTGVIGAIFVVFIELAAGHGLSADLMIDAFFAFCAAAVLVPMLVLTLAPAAEAAFGYASDLKLLELANLNHPALKALVLQAPGTYHHSIIMGSLVEAAAEAIGANPLLARSCAYYHDIGKGRNPAYFGENQKGENAHDQLAPQMSAMIIKRHVTEGLEMAREFKLPQLVADAIPQHHGTRLVGYFFHKAQKELEGKEGAGPIDDAPYRYPGPKPQFREAALVMIADAVEASSRSMPEPTTDKLKVLVQRMINLIFSEGQLDECDLTLRDLNKIAESFVRTLEGIYHARPAYPPGAIGAASRTTSGEVTLTVVKGGDGKKAGSQ